MTSTAKEDEARERAVDWLLQVQASPDDAVLRAGLERWLAESALHRAAYDSAQRMWRVAADLPKPPIDAPPPVRVRTSRNRGAVWRALAATAVAAGLLLAFLPAIQLWLQADAITGVAELRDVVLEDGSEVHLDAGSAVAVDYGTTQREVTLLAGEAFFEVVRSTRPFVVKAGGVTVTVVGTAFSVRSWEGSVLVAVRSGVVRVAVDGHSPPEMLTRGQRLRVDRDGQPPQRDDVAPDDIAAWRERRLVVDGASLADVVETLGRHYEGVIVIRDPAVAARRVTGVFDLGRPIEALEAIARAQHGSIMRISPYVTVVSGP
ncbi:MAG: FecR family protein [Pseudomonadota bacterium]